jgi:hypothetical protein
MKRIGVFFLSIGVLSVLILFSKLYAEITLEETVIQRRVLPPPSMLNNPEKYYESWEKNTGITERKTSPMKGRIEQAISEAIYINNQKYIYNIQSVRIIKITPRSGNNPVNQDAPVWNIHDSSGTHTFASREDYDNYVEGNIASSTSSSTSSSSTSSSESSSSSSSESSSTSSSESSSSSDSPSSLVCVAYTGVEPTSLSNVHQRTIFFVSDTEKKYTLFNEGVSSPSFMGYWELGIKYDYGTGLIKIDELDATITSGAQQVPPGTYTYEIEEKCDEHRKFRINITLEKQDLSNGETRITTTINSVCELPYN